MWDVLQSSRHPEAARAAIDEALALASGACYGPLAEQILGIKELFRL